MDIIFPAICFAWSLGGSFLTILTSSLSDFMKWLTSKISPKSLPNSHVGSKYNLYTNNKPAARNKMNKKFDGDLAEWNKEIIDPLGREKFPFIHSILSLIKKEKVEGHSCSSFTNNSTHAWSTCIGKGRQLCYVDECSLQIIWWYTWEQEIKHSWCISIMVVSTKMIHLWSKQICKKVTAIMKIIRQLRKTNKWSSVLMHCKIRLEFDFLKWRN